METGNDAAGEEEEEEEAKEEKEWVLSVRCSHSVFTVRIIDLYMYQVLTPECIYL